MGDPLFFVCWRGGLLGNWTEKAGVVMGGSDRQDKTNTAAFSLLDRSAGSTVL